MPEGDTIARAAARLRPLLVSEPLVEVRHRGAALRDLVGERVAAIDSHGKHMWIRLGPALAIHVHLGMEGRWTLVSPAGLRAAPGRVAAASLALVNRLGGALCLRAPTVELVRGPDARPAAGRAGFGPDILAEPLELDAIVARALAMPGGARPIGEVVLDQRVVAGIGNLWKSELLFLEGIDPRAAAAALAPHRLRALFARAGEMMRRSVGPHPRTPTGAPAAGRSPHRVYRRADRPCPRCGARIERILQGARTPRSTYFCGRCQTL